MENILNSAESNAFIYVSAVLKKTCQILIDKPRPLATTSLTGSQFVAMSLRSVVLLSFLFCMLQAAHVVGKITVADDV